LKNRLYLFSLVLVLALVFSGCGIFQDDIDTDIPVDEAMIADALNSFIVDYQILVGAYVEQLKEYLDDDQVDESDPAVYDLDEEFEAVLAHYDELVMGGYVVDEETFKEMFIEYILWDWEGWFIRNEGVVEIDYKYKYFIELPPQNWVGIFPFDYSEKPLRGFAAIVERTLTFGETNEVLLENNELEEEKRLINFYFSLVEYEDGFKVFYFLPFLKI